jgi:hypothetical protein
MTSGDHNRIDPQSSPTHDQLAAMVSQARRQRELAAAVRAESEQAQRQTRTLRSETSAILASAVAIIESVLERHGIGLAEPVAAKFRTDELGSTGIEVSLRLIEPDAAALARKAIIERLGGESRSDRVIIA